MYLEYFSWCEGLVFLLGLDINKSIGISNLSNSGLKIISKFKSTFTKTRPFYHIYTN